MADESPEKKTSLKSLHKHPAWSVIKIALSSILAGILGIVAAEPLKDWWAGPQSYKVYVIGNLRNSQESSSHIRDGFLEKGKPAMKIDGREIEFETRDDEGNPQVAERIAADLAVAEDTLMVVGHMSSTPTKAAMPYYLQKAAPPIPMILMGETNPHLLQVADADERDRLKHTELPVFRLPPTDDRQAQDAAAFAVAHGADNFWVVEDTENPIYSKYLALEFIREVQERKKSVLLWTANHAIPSAETFKALKTNCVLFTGNWTNALILIRQIKALSKNAGLPMPTVILTDSAVEKNLIARGGPDVEGVYVIYTMGAKEYGDGDQGFRILGKDARAVFDTLMDTASQRFRAVRKEKGGLAYWIKWVARVHRVTDARAVLNELMNSSMREKQVYDLPGGRKAQFVSGMKNQLATFRVWQIRDGAFQDVQQNTGVVTAH